MVVKSTQVFLKYSFVLFILSLSLSLCLSLCVFLSLGHFHCILKENETSLIWQSFYVSADHAWLLPFPLQLSTLIIVALIFYLPSMSFLLFVSLLFLLLWSFVISFKAILHKTVSTVAYLYRQIQLIPAHVYAFFPVRPLAWDIFFRLFRIWLWFEVRFFHCGYLGASQISNTSKVTMFLQCKVLCQEDSLISTPFLIFRYFWREGTYISQCYTALALNFTLMSHQTVLCPAWT